MTLETWGHKFGSSLQRTARRKRHRGSLRSIRACWQAFSLLPRAFRFTPSHAVNHGRRYRYYVERLLLTAEEHERGSGAPQLNNSRNGVAFRPKAGVFPRMRSNSLS